MPIYKYKFEYKQFPDTTIFEGILLFKNITTLNRNIDLPNNQQHLPIENIFHNSIFDYLQGKHQKTIR